MTREDCCCGGHCGYDIQVRDAGLADRCERDDEQDEQEGMEF